MSIKTIPDKFIRLKKAFNQALSFAKTAWDTSKKESISIFLTVISIYIKSQQKKEFQKNLKLHFEKRDVHFKIENRMDLQAIEEIFIDKEYAPASSLSEIGTIIDAGANIGAASIYFAIRYPQAKIFSFEPNPVLFERLKKNTESYKNITCFQIALGDQKGTLPFFVSKNHLGSSLLQRNINDVQINVEIKSLHDILTEHNLTSIDLLKCDIEGGEERVFKDSGFQKIVKNIVAEIHPDLINLDMQTFLHNFSTYHYHTSSLSKIRVLLIATQFSKKVT